MLVEKKRGRGGIKILETYCCKKKMSANEEFLL
jgi:hypothetical protein